MEKYPSVKNVCPPNQSTNIYCVPAPGKHRADQALFLAEGIIIF